MSEHRIAWALHNYELEQTIIRLRNSRNRLIEALELQTTRVIEREERLQQAEDCIGLLRVQNRELSDIIAAP